MTIDDMALISEEVVAEVVEAPRLFLTTPFADYTVTEGFLLLLFLFGFVLLIIWFFRGV